MKAKVIHTPTLEDFIDAMEQLSIRGLVFADGDALNDDDNAQYFEENGSDTILWLHDNEAGKSVLHVGSLTQYLLARALGAIEDDGAEVSRHEDGETITISGDVNPVDPTVEAEERFFIIEDFESFDKLIFEAGENGYLWTSGDEPDAYHVDVYEHFGGGFVVVVIEQSEIRGTKKLATATIPEIIEKKPGARLEVYNGQKLG